MSTDDYNKLIEHVSFNKFNANSSTIANTINTEVSESFDVITKNSYPKQQSTTDMSLVYKLENKICILEIYKSLYEELLIKYNALLEKQTKSEIESIAALAGQNKILLENLEKLYEQLDT